LKLEAGIPDQHHVIEWTLGRFGSCIHAMANGATLHNDDRVMSMLPDHPASKVDHLLP
jgi:hypothetical protein